MNKYKIIKIKVERLLFVGISILISLPLGFLTAGTVYAASDAFFTLAPNSGSYAVGSNIVLQISETSDVGDNVNAVQANLSYNTTDLQYISTSLNGPFTLVGQNSGGSGAVNIGIADSSTVSGAQNVAAVTFKALAPSTPAIDMTSGSNIDNNTGNSVWNSALPTSSFTLSYTSPTVSISSPANNGFVHGNAFPIDSTITENAGGTITNGQLYFNATLAQTVTNSPYNFSLSTLTYANGTYSLEVKTTDSLSLTNNQTINVVVNNGDLSAAGSVGISDLAIMASHWGATDSNYSDGNITGQATINISDLAILASNWNWSG